MRLKDDEKIDMLKPIILDSTADVEILVTTDKAEKDNWLKTFMKYLHII